MCIAKTLDRLDGRICTCQVIAQVGCQGLPPVSDLVAVAAFRVSKCDERDRQAERTQDAQNQTGGHFAPCHFQVAPCLPLRF